MAPNRGQNRAKELEKLYDDGLDARDLDIDPEAEDISEDDSDGDASNDSIDGEAAREHYVDVGKSNLRKPKEALLGPQYRGSRVGRDDLSDDEDDDPFGRGFEDGESDDESPGIGAAATSEEDDEEDATPESDMSDDEDEAARPGIIPPRGSGAGAPDVPTVGASLAKSNEADIEKGRAVKRQRKTFDTLLGTRMKLQKALVGANTVVAIPSGDISSERDDAAAVIEAAETAAFNLWYTLNSFRSEMQAARTGEESKSSFSIKTPTSKLWSHQQAQETADLEHRNATLQKWSMKTSQYQVDTSSKLTASAPQTTVLDVIQQHTADMPRLLARTRTPRSCAPVQAASKTMSDKNIYDDADFYGLLLKELLEQKSADSATATSNIDFSFQMRREAKTKKNVDTKASKGRKLRFTVHEKLQNFMAPEERRGWGDRQADELFGSLFGRRMELGEDAAEDEANGLDRDAVDPEDALLMFRR